ncbi:MAG: hypothetical protein ABJL99_04185 [Aliishimia sp.]
MKSRNAALNPDKDVYPTLIAISVVGASPVTRNSIARMILIRAKVWLQVMPISAEDLRANARGDCPQNFAIPSNVEA